MNASSSHNGTIPGITSTQKIPTVYQRHRRKGSEDRYLKLWYISEDAEYFMDIFIQEMWLYKMELPGFVEWKISFWSVQILMSMQLRGHRPWLQLKMSMLFVLDICFLRWASVLNFQLQRQRRITLGLIWSVLLKWVISFENCKNFILTLILISCIPDHWSFRADI